MASCALMDFGFAAAQKIAGVQLLNPKTNDPTAVIGFDGQLRLSFDDLSAQSLNYKYTIRHRNRLWEDDGLFFTEYANGNLVGNLNQMQYSFNTQQAYTHYQLDFPNEFMQPKISGNYELVVYTDSIDEPLITQRFSVYENTAQLQVKYERFADANQPELKQRVQVIAQCNGAECQQNAPSLRLEVLQNNNWQQRRTVQSPTGMMGNQMYFQNLNLAFPGNNEFYFWDTKNMQMALNTVAQLKTEGKETHAYLYPVWAFPNIYQYNPDANGAYWFRRNDSGIERDVSREGDYLYTYVALDSPKVDKEIYVLGLFNNYQANAQSKMYYDENRKQYLAKIYQKQGLYNYILATKNPDGSLNYGEVNGNFWETENLYQAFLYYSPFGRNYDGLLGYGEARRPIQ
jgi:Domain of unknown function (DUF5103)